MKPPTPSIYWLFLFLAICLIAALIASKKGRSGVIFFFSMAIPAVPLMLVVSYLLGDNMESKPLGMGLAAFLCPVAGFITAIMVDNKEQMAAKTGDFGDYRKCPFCAESVRKEAVKCKHCQSELSAG